MLSTRDPMYDLRKPPIILANRTAPFICCICERPGIGPLNSVAHPGKCRAKHTQTIAKRTAERIKLRKLKARGIVPAPILVEIGC